MQVWQTHAMSASYNTTQSLHLHGTQKSVNIQIIQLKITGISHDLEMTTLLVPQTLVESIPKAACPKPSFRITSYEQNTFTWARGLYYQKFKGCIHLWRLSKMLFQQMARFRYPYDGAQAHFSPHPPENSHALNSKMKVRKMLVINFSFQPFVFFGGCKISGMQVYPTPPTTTSDIHGLDTTLTLRGVVRPGKVLKLDGWWTKSGQANEMEHMSWDSFVYSIEECSCLPPYLGAGHFQ